MDKIAQVLLMPRLIRLRDAPAFLGMDKNRFNREVRSQLTEIPIGNQGVAFDRLEMDAWVDQYKKRNGRPVSTEGGKSRWDDTTQEASLSEAASGISTRLSVVSEYASQLGLVPEKKLKSISIP